MPLKKLLLKTANGTALGAACLSCGDHPKLLLPQGFILHSYEVNGRVFFGEDVILPQSKAFDLSLHGLFLEESAFATTRSGEAATFAKWQLTQAEQERFQEEKLPKSPLEEAPSGIPEKEPEVSAPKQEVFPAPIDVICLEPPEPESPLLRAERLLASGEPFVLFQEWMPNVRWAKIEKDDSCYLIGIADEDPPRILCGIPGTKERPPQEEGVWSFFPIDEENGYYLTDATTQFFA